MLLNCTNPNCSAEFLYLYEGELFLIELPNRAVERYWLCRECSQSMGVIYDASQGARMVPRDVARNSVHRRTVA
jgi:hypothetical protein